MLNSVRHGAAVLGSLAEVAVKRYMAKVHKHNEGGDDDVSVSVHDVFSHVDDGLFSGAVAGAAAKEGGSIAAGLSGPAYLDGFTKRSSDRNLGLGRFAERERFFTASELKILSKAIAATRATGELLGRSRIRLRQQQARTRKHAEGFTESGTDFACFADDGLHPMAPLQAVKYFTGLVPTLKVDPQRFGDAMERDAFTLAEATDDVILGKVQDALAEALKTGKGDGGDIKDILDSAGVTPSNPGYAEMVFRTNAMDSYNVGSTKEMQDPDVADDFPAWQYLGIADNRQGDDHAVNNDTYHRNEESFAEVRGDRVFNCRCTFAPIWSGDWEQLQADGADFS